MKGPVRPGSRKGSKCRMERYRVDTIDVCGSIRGALPMAFKREVHTGDKVRRESLSILSWDVGKNLLRILILNVLNRASPLDAPDGESRGIWKAADHPSLPL